MRINAHMFTIEAYTHFQRNTIANRDLGTLEVKLAKKRKRKERQKIRTEPKPDIGGCISGAKHVHFLGFLLFLFFIKGPAHSKNENLYF